MKHLELKLLQHLGVLLVFLESLINQEYKDWTAMNWRR